MSVYGKHEAQDFSGRCSYFLFFQFLELRILFFFSTFRFYGLNNVMVDFFSPEGRRRIFPSLFSMTLLLRCYQRLSSLKCSKWSFSCLYFFSCFLSFFLSFFLPNCSRHHRKRQFFLLRQRREKKKTFFSFLTDFFEPSSFLPTIQEARSAKLESHILCMI